MKAVDQGKHPNDFRTGYVRRVIDNELDDLFDALPAILIDGPKGVGKTATSPALWETVRRRVDHNPAAGQFLLTGSTHINLANIITGPEAYTRPEGNHISLAFFIT